MGCHAWYLTPSTTLVGETLITKVIDSIKIRIQNLEEIVNSPDLPNEYNSDELVEYVISSASICKRYDDHIKLVQQKFPLLCKSHVPFIVNTLFKLIDFNSYRSNCRERLDLLKLELESKEFSEEALYCALSNSCSGLMQIYNNKVYEEVPIHGIIKIWGYPTDVITSYEEMVIFLQQCKYNDLPSEEQLHQLKEFWEKYPEGIVTFG